MSNTLLTNDIIAKAALPALKNNLAFAKMVDRQYQPVFSNTTGDTIRIRKPIYYTVRSGANAVIQDIDQQTVPLTISFQKGIDLAVTSKELSLSLDSFNRSILEPSMRQLANQIDMDLYASSIQIANAVGTPGTAPNSFASISNAQALLNSLGVDQTRRFAMLQSIDANALRVGLNNQFNDRLTTDILLKGSLGELAGFDVYDVQNVIRPEVSSDVVGTPAVNGASQTGSSLITDGWTPDVTLYAGATFTIAGVYALNPMSQQSTGQLRTFVSTADATADGSGNMTIPIYPSLTTTAPYGTITVAPADNALLTVNAIHNINLAFQEQAFTLAMISMPADNNNGAYQRNMVDADAGISIRMSRQYQIYSDQDVIRFDVLYGIGCFPDYACRIMGS